MFNNEKFIKCLSVFVTAIVFLAIFIFYNISSKENQKQEFALNEFIHEGDDIEIVENEDYEKIFVEIKGEVVNPDVYELAKGSIVKDLILLSGGLTSDADIFNINQARELKNGECILIFSKNQMENYKNEIAISEIGNFEIENLKEDDSLVNLNTASKDELKSLNGIGEGLAQSIIDYREANGSFKTIEEIKNVNRIGQKTFEKFKDKIKV